MKKISASIFLLASLSVFQSCSHDKAEETSNNREEAVAVRVMPIQKEFYNQPIIASGQFTTDDETVLSFKTGGVVKSVMAEEGEFIHHGQLLATLDLTEINSQVNQAQLGYEKSQRDFQRAENLYKDSVITLEQFQNVKTGLDVSAQQLNAAKFNLAYSEIRAVSDGYVLKKFVNAGQVVNPGSPVYQTNGAGKANWILKVGVSDKEWSAITLGDKANIETDAFPGKTINAIVSRKSGGADAYSGSFTIELKLTDKNPLSLGAGLFGKATIYPSNKMETWSIPYEALLDGNANTGFVFITNDNKTAHKIPVTIAAIDNNKVHISNGLDSAQLLIVSGSAYLSDNSLITIVK